LIGQILGIFFVSDWDVSRVRRVGTEVSEGYYDFPVDFGSIQFGLYVDHAV
jgi:hypothetical protein